MRQIIFLLSAIMVLVSGLFRCTNRNIETSNFEQIYEAEGVPVRTVQVAPQPFETEISFNSVLSGIQESSAFAKIADKVEKVYVKVGDYVQKEAVLLTFPTDNPTANYYQAKVSLENSKATFERMENLYKSGGISLQELDNARAAFEVAKANWDAARQTVKVTAPIRGYVTKVNVHESDNVIPGTELFMISRIDKMKAKVWISEKEIVDIKKGAPAFAIWNNVEFEGKVVQVDLAMNQRLKAFQAVVEFENPENRLRCGLTIEVKIKAYRNPRAIVVERKNLLKDRHQFYVYLAKDGFAERIAVTPGRQQGTMVEITQGLSPGDLLITEGQMHLEPGTKIREITEVGDHQSPLTTIYRQ